MKFYVLLENIRSKFNVGAIFRTAEAFSFEKVILTGFTPQIPDKEISKTAIGAEEYVKWQYWQNSIDAVKELKSKGIKIVSAEIAENSVKLQDISMDSGILKNTNNEGICIVLGNEIIGISKKILDLSDIIVEIPMLGEIKKSLNVEVAFGIIASWIRFSQNTYQ